MVQWIWLFWMKRLECGRMSQDEHPQKCARARHKASTKEGSNNALGRHCANRTPLRWQGATHQKGARQNLHSAWFSKHTTWLGFTTRHAWNTLISSTENCVSNCYQRGTPWQQQGDREPKENKIRPKRVETRFKTLQLQDFLTSIAARFLVTISEKACFWAVSVWGGGITPCRSLFLFFSSFFFVFDVFDFFLSLFLICLIFSFFSFLIETKRKQAWRASRSVVTSNQPTKVFEFVKLILWPWRPQSMFVDDEKMAGRKATFGQNWRKDCPRRTHAAHQSGVSRMHATRFSKKKNRM